MAKVTGIGGLFFRTNNPEKLAAWYETHLGIGSPQTTIWRQDAGVTVFAPFAMDTDYFGKPDQQWMVNFRVDDLDGTMAKRRHAPNGIRKSDASVGSKIRRTIRSNCGNRRSRAVDEVMALQHDLGLIQSLEEELFKQTVRGSAEAMDMLLAENFVEFGRSGGVYRKEGIVRDLIADKEEISLTASDFELTSLADDVVLLTYRSVRKLVAGGKELHSLRSSIWKFMDGRWQMIFHQGTPTQP